MCVYSISDICFSCYVCIIIKFQWSFRLLLLYVRIYKISDSVVSVTLLYAPYAPLRFVFLLPFSHFQLDSFRVIYVCICICIFS